MSRRKQLRLQKFRNFLLYIFKLTFHLRAQPKQMRTEETMRSCRTFEKFLKNWTSNRGCPLCTLVRLYFCWSLQNWPFWVAYVEQRRNSIAFLSLVFLKPEKTQFRYFCYLTFDIALSHWIHATWSTIIFRYLINREFPFLSLLFLFVFRKISCHPVSKSS